jgi:hypothetical protein
VDFNQSGAKVKICKYIAVFLVITGLSLIGPSCEKPDNLPQLLVEVLDEQDQPVPGAFVALFKDYESWLSRENPVQVWRTTHVTGLVLFTDLAESEYFIYVRSGDKDNSMNEYHVSESLRMNVRKKVEVHIQ